MENNESYQLIENAVPQVVAPPHWIEEFEAEKAFLERLKGPELQQSEFEQSIQRAKERLAALKVDTNEDATKSDEEWEDVDTSHCSNKSLSSKGTSRNANIVNAKKVSLIAYHGVELLEGAILSSRVKTNLIVVRV